MAKNKAQTPDPQQPQPDEPQQPTPADRPDRTDRREGEDEQAPTDAAGQRDERIGDSAISGQHRTRETLIEKPNGHRTVATERDLTRTEREQATVESPEQYAQRSMGSDWNDRRQRR